MSGNKTNNSGQGISGGLSLGIGSGIGSGIWAGFDIKNDDELQFGKQNQEIQESDDGDNEPNMECKFIL